MTRDSAETGVPQTLVPRRWNVERPIQSFDDQSNTTRASMSRNPTEAGRQPPPETRRSVWMRRAVVASFWAVVAFLGLPVWWKTTAIYRADLPLQDMTAWANAKVNNTLHGHIRGGSTHSRLCRFAILCFRCASPWWTPRYLLTMPSTYCAPRNTCSTVSMTSPPIDCTSRSWRHLIPHRQMPLNGLPLTGRPTRTTMRPRHSTSV